MESMIGIRRQNYLKKFKLINNYIKDLYMNENIQNQKKIDLEALIQSTNDSLNIIILYATKGEAFSKTKTIQELCESLSDKTKVNFIPVEIGVGKVNALINTIFAGVANPSIIVNIGAVGSNKFKFGDVVSVNRFIQRDFDLTVLGEDKYSNKDDVFELNTPFIDIKFENQQLNNIIKEEMKASGMIVRDVISCGTGDSLVTNPNYQDYDVVDMEAFAIAKYCKITNLPFFCFKVISDGSDDTAKSWDENLKEINEKLFNCLEQFLTRLINKEIK